MASRKTESRKSIFSWAGLAKFCGIPYHHFYQKKLSDEEKQAVIPVLEEEINSLLEGSYRVIEAFSIDIDTDTD
jgi:hypothetical protein